jgi:hypothetical protein
MSVRSALARARGSMRVLFIAFVFGVSIVPGALTVLPLAPRLEQGLERLAVAARPAKLDAWLQWRGWQRLADRSGLTWLSEWWRLNVIVAPVEELRPLAALPEHWEGRVVDIDKNYARFDRWFTDHLALRTLMIRTKNELDYRLFRSSGRVYFGANDELYGRNLADNELPGTEALLAAPEMADQVYRGVLRFGADLRAQGVTMLLIAPVQKQYFTRERLPFFAPRVPDDSHFMALHARLKQAGGLHYIDTVAIMRANQARFPIFFRQDFHWTDPLALLVAQETTDRIARLEGSAPAWRHRLAIDYKPFIGTEARFSARLIGSVDIVEPTLAKTWTDVHAITTLDAAASGLEFETDRVDGRGLLADTCMYGNSFSDSMLRAGLAEHFAKFTKISRAVPLPAVPALVKGRCKYLIVQVLDIQTDRWKSLATR